MRALSPFIPLLTLVASCAPPAAEFACTPAPCTPRYLLECDNCERAAEASGLIAVGDIVVAGSRITAADRCEVGGDATTGFVATSSCPFGDGDIVIAKTEERESHVEDRDGTWVLSGAAIHYAEERCDDGIDNDGDGLSDCDAPSCRNHHECGGRDVCNDGIDNDGDLLFDCDDTEDCQGDPSC